MPAPMTTTRFASWRLRGAAGLALTACLGLAACSTADPSPTPDPTPDATPGITASPAPTASPTPSPAPTPRFTNEPDEGLDALIPAAAGSAPVVVAPLEDVALTPGDIGLSFGKLGTRFASLALAYVEQPRTSLYAVRVDGEPVTTQDLEPYLATAGRFVGIAGLDRQAWELSEAGGHRVWMRGEDNATASGTMIYTWSSGEFVFLLIGVDDTVNRSLIAQLPGEPAPTPTPQPTESPTETDQPSASPSGG